MDEMQKLMDEALENFNNEWNRYQEKQIKNIILKAKAENKPYYILNNLGHLSILVDNILYCPKFEFQADDGNMRLFVEQGTVSPEDLMEAKKNIIPGRCFSTQCNNQTLNSYCESCEKEMGVYE